MLDTNRSQMSGAGDIKSVCNGALCRLPKRATSYRRLLARPSCADLTATVAAQAGAQSLDSRTTHIRAGPGQEQLRRFLTQGVGYPAHNCSDVPLMSHTRLMHHLLPQFLRWLPRVVFVCSSQRMP